MKNALILAVVGTLAIFGLTAAIGNNGERPAENQVSQQKRTHPAAQKDYNNATRISPAKPKAKVANSKDDHMNAGGMKWMTIEEAAGKTNKEKKKYLVDVYTDWCGWCKVMDKKTFTDPTVKAYLKDNFHIIKFNAEQKEAIQFKGKTYEWMPAGRRGVNKLAVELLGSRLSYPTLVYLDENMNKIRSSPGYKKPDQLMAELKSIAGS